MRIVLFFFLTLWINAVLSGQTKTNFSFKSVCLPNSETSQTLDMLKMPMVKPYHFGAICRWENNSQANAKVPILFRLGSADYVKKLENQYVVTYGQHSYHYKPRSLKGMRQT